MSHTFSDGKIQCPYNKAHILINNIRAISHLTKCRQQHPEMAKRIRICPYNQSHHIPIDDIDGHYKLCDDFKAAFSFAVSQNPGRPSPVVADHGPSLQTSSNCDDNTGSAVLHGSTVPDNDISEWM